MPVEERGLRCGGIPKGCKPAGVALPITPLYKGEKKEPGGITCRSEGAGPTMVGGSVPLGREQAWGASERGMAGEAVAASGSWGHANLRSRCDRHGRKRPRTGVPRARRMIPLESRMREIRTSGSGGRGWKRTYGSRTGHRRESRWINTPDPKGTAPPPYPTARESSSPMYGYGDSDGQGFHASAAQAGSAVRS